MFKKIILKEFFYSVIDIVEVIIWIMTRTSNPQAVNPNRKFRLWVYFRIGWASYFAFIFAMINTLITTFYLAIDNIPFLQEIFPSFAHYFIITTIVGVPLLIGMGYFHFKRSQAFKAESDIRVETNKHQFRMLDNSEFLLSVIFKLNSLLIKKMNNETICDSELDEIKKLQVKIGNHKKNRTIHHDTLTEFDEII